jgi:CheY-like chemotaxis protein
VRKALTEMAEQNPVVLVCDDEVGIVTAIGGFLRAKGCTVLTAGNAVEAIAIGTEQASRLQLVVMDVMMPDALGPAVVDELLKLNPALKVLYLSGHAQDENMYNGPAKLPMAMLHKPCSLTVLWKVVQDLLAFRDVVGEGR